MALDEIQQILETRGLEMPKNLIVQADNTTREQRNQYLMQYLIYLCGTGRFKSAMSAFFEVGHTHNRVDQRFSIVRGILAKADVLETPQELANCCLNKLLSRFMYSLGLIIQGSLFGMMVQGSGLEFRAYGCSVLTPNSTTLPALYSPTNKMFRVSSQGLCQADL